MNKNIDTACFSYSIDESVSVPYGILKKKVPNSNLYKYRMNNNNNHLNIFVLGETTNPNPNNGLNFNGTHVNALAKKIDLSWTKDDICKTLQFPLFKFITEISKFDVFFLYLLAAFCLLYAFLNLIF